MQTVAASIILEDAERAIDWDLTNLETRQNQMARNALSLALQEIWESWWWEALMKVTPQKFAADYVGITGASPDGWTYPNGTPVYFAPTDAYYVNLWPAGPPALQVGETYADYSYNIEVPDLPVTTITENLYGWSKYKPCIVPQPTLWNVTLTPALGDQVFWDGNIFQWIVDQGALPNNVPDPVKIYPNVLQNPGWMVVQPWNPTLPFTLQTPDRNNPFNLIDTLSGTSGPIHTICRLDPRTTPGGRRYHQRVADDASGVVVLGLDVGMPFVATRRVTPIVTGDDFDTGASYEAASATDLVFDS